jgi:hypothetical protein
MIKICKNCKIEKEIKNGLLCNKCIYNKRKEYSKNYYKINKDSIIEKRNIYIEDNKDKIQQIRDKYYCSEHGKKYYFNYNRTKRKYLKKEGYIYIIINPAWSEYIKLGRSENSDIRLYNYQTYSPLRDYEIYYNKYVTDLIIIERYFNDNIEKSYNKNEWFKIDKDEAILIIESLINL